MISNTFGLPATADRYLEIDSLDALRALFEADQPVGRYYVVGAASNIIFTGHYSGTILRLVTRGVAAVADPDDADCRLVTAEAGEPWDDFVRHCVQSGWYGLENLVAIPGTVGAAPVQNVGAYGREAADSIHSVHLYDTQRHALCTFSAADCRFAYRDSVFKHETGRYIVLRVTFRLSTRFVPCLEYQGLRQYLHLPSPQGGAGSAADADASCQQAEAFVTPETLVEAITNLRWSKLPRPEEVGSAGSFFKNPVVDEADYQRLLDQYPDLVAYPVKVDNPPIQNCYKLSAGWLIEHAGWKGRSLGRCGVYERQALVLVNRGGCTGSEVVALAEAIVKDVQTQFGVTLHPEAIFL